MYNKYLEIAQHDLKASVCLYKNGLYPQALFYFQQSTEKTAKALAYRVGVSDNEVKQSSHSSSKIYRGIFNSVQNKINIFNRLILVSKLDQISGKYEKMTDEELAENALKGLEQLMRNERLFDFDFNDDNEIGRLTQLLQNETTDSPFLNRLTVNFVKFIYRQLMKFENSELRQLMKISICIFIIVFKLNLVSNRLVSNVRYLNSSEDVIPELTYTLVHPLVSILPQMTDALRHAQQHLPLILNTESVK